MKQLTTPGTNLLVAIGITAAIAAPASADSLNASDMAFAFGGKSEGRFETARGMSPAEMKETQGAIAPLVAVGFMTGTRFIVQRYVTQRAATGIVSRGGSVLAANRQQAAAIARNASGGRTPVREFHPGPGQRFTHYHTTPRNGSHVWYGRPR